jgi:hypothetical protein
VEKLTPCPGNKTATESSVSNRTKSTAAMSAPIQWGKPGPVAMQTTPVGPGGFTSSGNSAAVLFDTLKAELNGAEGGLSAASFAAFQLPVRADLKKGFLGFLMHIRGAVATSAGGRVSLAVSINGRTEVAKLNVVDGTAADVRFLHEQFAVEQRGPAETNPKVPPLEPLLVTFTLVAKRSSLQDVAMLIVDGVDVLACFG